MKNDDTAQNIDPLDDAFRQVLHTALTTTDEVTLLTVDTPAGPLRHGFHCHDAWELFYACRGDVLFEVAGRPARSFRQGALLMVHPDCMHMSFDDLPQPDTLELLVLTVPQAAGAYASIHLAAASASYRRAVSTDEVDRWTGLMGLTPDTVLARAAEALTAGPWGRQRGLAHLRLLFSAAAETVVGPGSASDRLTPGQHKAAAAMTLLQTRYFDPGLTVPRIAAMVNLSPSHLASTFRKTMGRTVYQTLIDIRLRRAADLLAHTQHSIKQIAALTGWSNQLYFSAAFRKHYRQSPTAWRRVTTSTSDADPTG